ncbi:Spx/MgsR family RNA polymerase-binding regulatory protein [Lactococcus kimchii]|uniref:Spx/MgsR family RNA polymerase-binding regulatory protein n=1 Tax=Lactococcus sp. S-13 TaxID=2507158 RepID=UPI00102341E0|nr:Spx/MgsR family RNA polymerase-binding regulatory protein [Lactococcus sp. S-13]RZI49855.1 Spx/MgsR family RNA polymerase-binding regulatory protein [Lactococcus sp. S-13]
MIKLFSSTNCVSSKKMKQWLMANKLEFKEINILENSLQRDDIMRILSLTELGAEEIISKRSNIYKELSQTIEFDELTTNQLVDLIIKNHRMLRRPLLVDDYRLQVGYNEDDIRKFLPRAVRKVELITAIENVRSWDTEVQALLG